MRYLALVTDYDGSLAVDGAISAEAIAALERLRLSGRKAVLVTVGGSTTYWPSVRICACSITS